MWVVKWPINNSSTVFIDSEFQCRRALVNFILSHAEGDCSPHLKVSILGYNFLGLLDSGSSVTLVGGSILKTSLDLGLVLNTSRKAEFRVADGSMCTSLGTISTPICLEGKVKVLDILAIPQLSSSLILGADFWMTIDVVPDLRRNVWHFGPEPLPTVSGIQTGVVLTDSQRTALEAILTEKFARMKSGLGYTTLLEHDIVLENNTKPVKQRYYPVSPPKQRIFDDELNRMLKEGIVEPSRSPWSSPVILVPKDGGKTYRFCVDYRALNAVTKKDVYPIPYISAILDRLKGARWLSSLDIKSAYHQVSVEASSREYTAFTIPGRV